ncbi:hypothetical protein DRZ77_00475 [Candidatus Woesearchaeota archaeon]|nr:hypothetical protein [Candidatus Woesearchaeota archaeon]RLE41068.1 MAG: hypothetical protein DRZ77_00475 [Candidatus Woesearchaeota archaeon]
MVEHSSKRLFDYWKKKALTKKDKSKKAAIDERIKPLLNVINKHPNFYTTSSCSGRIVLLATNDFRKPYSKWLFVSHEKTDLTQLKEALKELPKETVWLRQEPPILHVCCRTLEEAIKLVQIARSVGFKRSGIQSLEKNAVEIASVETLEIPIAENKKLIVTTDQLGFFLKKANKKLAHGWKRIKELKEKFAISFQHA